MFQIGRTILVLRGLCHSFGVVAHAPALWRAPALAALADAEAVPRACLNKWLDNGEDHADEDGAG